MYYVTLFDYKTGNSRVIYKSYDKINCTLFAESFSFNIVNHQNGHEEDMSIQPNNALPKISHYGMKAYYFIEKPKAYNNNITIRSNTKSYGYIYNSHTIEKIMKISITYDPYNFRTDYFINSLFEQAEEYQKVIDSLIERFEKSKISNKVNKEETATETIICVQ